MTPWLSNSPTTMDLPQEAGDRYTADEFADMIGRSVRRDAGAVGAPAAHILEHRERVWLTRPRDIYAYVASLPAGVGPGSR
jgi:hypothetical protein